MKIAIFGLGYVGLTSAACLIDQGYSVIGVDINEYKLKQLKNGVSPINEPGVEGLLKKGIDNGQFSVTNNTNEAIGEAQISMVCVGTPSSVSGSHDMSFIINVSRQIAEAIKNRVDSVQGFYHEVVFRSTMAPGSIDDLIVPVFERQNGIKEGENWTVFYNPEFLRESTAIHDYFNPPKIVIGSRNNINDRYLNKIYEKIDAPIFHVGIRESEITKFLDNSFHALKVAFANEVGRLCKTLNINTEEVVNIFLSDTKLNISKAYLTPGAPFGGSCLPKDVRALSWLFHSNGIKSELIDGIIPSNESHKDFLFKYIENEVNLNSKLLIVGISFKSNTDDLRESPQIDLIQRLIGRGYDLRVYDPDIEFGSIHGKNLAFSYARIPHLETYLISKKELQKLNDFDKILLSKNIDLPFNPNQDSIIKINQL